MTYAPPRPPPPFSRSSSRACRPRAAPRRAAADVAPVPREVAGARDIGRLDGGVRLDRVMLVLPRRDPDGPRAPPRRPARPRVSRLSPLAFARRVRAAFRRLGGGRRRARGLAHEPRPRSGGRAGRARRARLLGTRGRRGGRFRHRASRGLRRGQGPDRERAAAAASARSRPAGHGRALASLVPAPPPPRAPGARVHGSRAGHSLAPADFTAIYNVDALAAAGINGSRPNDRPPRADERQRRGHDDSSASTSACPRTTRWSS